MNTQTPLFSATPVEFPLDNTLAVLKVYAFYRLILASLLMIMFGTAIAPNILGVDNPTLFKYCVNTYTLITCITLIRLFSSKFSASKQHIFLICLVDIVATSLLMHSSGGISSGLGLLLFVSVSAASILVPGQISILLAALATIAIIAETAYGILYQHQDLATLVPAGILGGLLFISAFLFIYLTKSMESAAQEAELEASQRFQLQQLNELIIQKMLTGIIVLSPDGKIRLINESAARLLQLPLTLERSSDIDMSFADIPALYECLMKWHENPDTHSYPVKLEDGSPDLQLSFAGLENEKNADIIVFVEDTRDVAQQAQQLKLASLGHLTASIAHEIRNPLSAISHSAQLLAESTSITDHDVRLTQIIRNHSDRVNQIIENVQQLSQRKKPLPKKLKLKTYLQDFIAHYNQAHSEPVNISVGVDDDSLEVSIDPSQMEQVLSNLCDNGIRASLELTGQPDIHLHGYIDESLGTPCLDIVDKGAGIPQEDQEKMFEPFYTTNPTGTGLGLYLARELCESNQAKINYQFLDNIGSCFRISFAHPDKTLRST